MRLDKYVEENFKLKSRTLAKTYIEKGFVTVNGKRGKPSFFIMEGDEVKLEITETTFASNGGYKLQKGLDEFSYEVTGKVFADIGASNGGFTDCLLKNGAKKVFAVDVGISQLEDYLKSDKRVVVLDNTNAKSITPSTFKEKIDSAVIDVSFISLTHILKPAYDVVADAVLALIKPQFEVGKGKANKSGIVINRTYRTEAVLKVVEFAKSIGFALCGFCKASSGEKKNMEYMAYFSKLDRNCVSEETIKSII